MSKAFVTGATGFIGQHVALYLLERGWQVRALRRVTSPRDRLCDTGIEWVEGDLRDPEAMRRLVRGASAVFHVAADYRLWARHPRELYASNVQGTENVLSAALEAGVERVVYTSSVGALGLRPDGSPADETTPVRLEDMIGHYKRSKFLAERTAESFLTRGLPLVLVHPSTPVGPGDHKPTPTGQIIVDFLNGRMPAYLNTGLNLVHVTDVAAGHWLACEKGRTGEKYILGNENLTLSAIFERLEAVSGVPAPRFRLPFRPVLAAAYGCAVLSRLTGRAPLIPLEGVKMAQKLMFFTATKAVRELGLPQTPVQDALKEAVDWFRANGYVHR